MDSSKPYHNHAEHTNGVTSNHKESDADASLKPVAIVGMAMRLPGGVRDAEGLCDLLSNKKGGRCEVPADRYNIDAFYSPYKKKGTVSMRHGYFLQDADLQALDESFFAISKTEAETMDPQQRMLLEVVWECMANAGQANWRGTDIGCYVGTFGEDWLDMGAKDTQNFGIYRVSGTGDFFLANRVSYEFDLQGPSMVIKSGCSASMLCLNEAFRALQSRECSSAIVAGTNLIMTPTMTINMSEQGAVSPTGSCKTFDAQADGYARGEAINALYLKPLDTAIRDRDPIRAVIRAVATNVDGKTVGISNPNPEAQEALIRMTYDMAGITDLSQTAFVECHGTGTVVGDPLETHAVANAFGDQGVYIGSVKPNLGHSEGASGISSIIKSVLALENRTILPNINFSKPNPKIPFVKAKLKVPLDCTPWPEDRLERISVNSFGIGGANAHAIVDSAASFGINTSPHQNGVHESGPRLLVFSAGRTDSLKRSLNDYQEYVRSHPGSVEDLAYTLSSRRDHLNFRAYSISNGSSLLEFSPIQKIGPIPNVHFTFTGQGAQWPGMAKELAESLPSFAKDLESMSKALRRLAHPPEWDLADELLKPEGSSRVNEAEFSQPLCTAVQVALIKLLRRFGVRPTTVVGHSSGEIAAAFACGAIMEEEAITIAYYRGWVTKQQAQEGVMAAIGLGKDEVESFLSKGVVVACENSPANVTVSGDTEAVESVCDRVREKRPDVLVRRLKVEKAYHSHHMAPLGSRYTDVLAKIDAGLARDVPFYSSVTGGPLTASTSLGPSYWVDNLQSPVLFFPAVRSILRDYSGKNLFLEIGPHSALAGPLKQIFQSLGHECSYEGTLLRSKDGTECLLNTVGRLHCHNVSIDFSAVNPPTKVLTNLPLYPWHHNKHFWNESRVSREWRLRKFPHHDLIGACVTEATELEPSWRNLLRLDDVPWVRDHKINEDVVLPAAAYIAMAGEAVRQLSGSEDFSVRHFVIDTALMLNDSDTTEIITSLRPVRLTDSLDSPWYEFQVSSHKGTSWTRNCRGEVRAGSEIELAAPAMDQLPVGVSSTHWYKVMRKVGLNYGPSFQGLMNVCASPIEPVATAEVKNATQRHESAYQIHPASIDCCLQLFTVALSKGMSRNMEDLSVPIEIKELYVGPCVSEIQILADASGQGHAVGVSDGKVIFHLNGLVWKALEGQTSESSDVHRGAHLLWKKDIDFVDPNTLIHPVESRSHVVFLAEKLTVLCIFEALHRLKQVTTNTEHLLKFQSWLQAQVSRAERNENDILSNVSELARLSNEDRQATLHQVTRQLEECGATPVTTPLWRILDNIVRIFEDPSLALDVLHEGDALTNLYSYMSSWSCEEFMDLLTHSKPDLRVLEIGAGTGGTTACALKDLVSPTGRRLYSSYTYTDISAGFFIAAKQRFSEYQMITYATLDISRDPPEQGFEEGSYDLILATNVLHATPKLHDTLQHARKLLHADGHLFFQELYPTTQWLSFAMGTLPGWWLGELDDRPTEPYVSPERWTRELEEAGFARVEAVVYDNEFPNQVNISYLARPAECPPAINRVTVLCNASSSSVVSQVKERFAADHVGIDVRELGQSLPGDQAVVSVLDLEEPFFDNITDSRLELLKKRILDLKSAGLLWVTKAAQMKCHDPRFSFVHGLARTIRAELSVNFATLEVDGMDATVWTNVLKVLRKIQAHDRDGKVDPDFEFALSRSDVYIPRFEPISIPKALSKTRAAGTIRLHIDTFGLLDTLRWKKGRSNPLHGDEVEIETKAAGLNFRDLLIAMGIVGWSLIGLGGECSGIVRAVGPEVRELKVGDRVAAMANWTFATQVFASEKVCVKMPDDLGFEDAATMVAVFSTVIYSLVDLARIEKGSTVLIHSACSGVGLAALQLCQHFGAKVYVTVGNAQKVQYLQSTMGLSRDQIFNSRDASFLPAVLKATNGKGVDIVLNSLSGDLLHASWQCVAQYGRMIELGKRDFIGHGKLEMSVFEANRSFFGVDLAHISVNKPTLCKRLLEECIEYYRAGVIKPIRPIKVFEAADVQEPFRYMQKGQHLGKIIVRLPENPDDLPSETGPTDLCLRSDVSYLVAGFGGIGRSISSWMVEHGAKHLILLSRSGDKSPENKKFIRILETMGCAVEAPAGSVTDLPFVRSVVENAKRPVAGIIQTSMVLQDRAFLDMSLEDWNTAVSPKAKGTWTLHEASKSTDLEFFVLMSSLSGLLGSSGQANYAAGNTFQDAFVNFRRGQGLPASVLDVGIVEDVGFVSENPHVLERYRNTHTFTIDESRLLDAVHVAIRESPVLNSEEQPNTAQTAIALGSTLPLNDPTNRYAWRRDARLRTYCNVDEALVSASSTGGDDKTEDRPARELRQLLSSIAAGSKEALNVPTAYTTITQGLAHRLLSFLLRSDAEADMLDDETLLTRPLSVLGMDSLVAIEFRNWWRRALGFEISVLEILDAGTIGQLGQVAIAGLKSRHGVGENIG